MYRRRSWYRRKKTAIEVSTCRYPAARAAAVDTGHIGVAVPGRGRARVRARKLFSGEDEAIDDSVLLQARDALGTGDRGDVPSLAELPGQVIRSAPGGFGPV
jgi:hypothetical protein